MADSPYILEGERILREGETRTWSIIWNQFSTMSTAGCEAYTNGSSESASLLAGTTSIVGNTLTLPTLTVPAGRGGTNIVVEPAVSVNSQVYKTGIIIRVLKPGAER